MNLNVIVSFHDVEGVEDQTVLQVLSKICDKVDAAVGAIQAA